MSAPASPEAGPGGAPVAVDQSGADEQAWRSARRTLALFVVAVAAAAIGVIALLTGLVGEGGGDTTVGSAADRRDAEVTTIGPDAGTDVGAYVEARRTHLTEIEGRRAAVVSFAGYRTEQEVDDLLVDGVEVVSLLLAFPSGESMVAESVDDARAAVVGEAEAQLASISELVDTVEDPEFAEFYRAELLRYRALVDGADGEDVVHGAVVVGRAGDLRAVASRDGVRLVDAGTGPDLADDATVSGLRPEESVTTGEPPFRP